MINIIGIFKGWCRIHQRSDGQPFKCLGDEGTVGPGEGQCQAGGSGQFRDEVGRILDRGGLAGGSRGDLCLDQR